MSHIFYVNNDNILDTADSNGDGLKELINGTFLNSATVTGTIRVGESAASAAVTGITQPVTFSYIAASNGRYVGTFDKLLAIVAGTTYYGHITAASGSSDANIIVKILAKTRLQP